MQKCPIAWPCYNERVTNWVLTALVALVLVFQVALVVFLYLVVKRAVSKLRELQAFFEPIEKDQPSPAGKLYQDLVAQASLAMARQIKTTVMGFASGQSRAEQAVMKEVVDNSPIGPLAAAIPGMSKKFAKNPGLAEIAIRMLGGMLNRGGPGPAGNGHGPPAELPGFGARHGKL